MTGENSGNGRERAALVLGAAALVGFAVLVVYMLSQITASEAAWGRALYIFGGVEAIAFAAAGYFFGREVNRQRAESAESRAAQAEGRKQEAEARAGQAAVRAAEAEARGQSLRAAIQARAGARPEGADAKLRAAGGADDLAQLAEELFPRAR